jgi:uncharacterized protein (DUF1501 family)
MNQTTRRTEDDDVREAMARLSIVDDTDEGWSRRQVLLAALAGSAAAVGGASTLGGVEAHAAGSRGNLLIIQLAGGNDAFNMVPPTVGTLAGQYRQARGSLAITDALPARVGRARASSFGFHPSMPFVASQYSAGRVAVVRGVGYPNHSRSHFDAIATWMTASARGALAPGGWIGRWLDTLPVPKVVDSVQIGYSVPPHMVGLTRKAATLGLWEPGFGTSEQPDNRRAMTALATLAGTAGERGPLASRFAGATVASMTLNRAAQPLYHRPTELAGEDIERSLQLAARLFEANIGVRVVSTLHGDFDHHAGELSAHADVLGALDRGLRAFFRGLSPAVAQRTVVMTFSEFGRKLHVNDSRGTDHGRAGHMLVLGARVRGGMYGRHPSFSRLGDYDDPAPTLDFRSVYAGILQGWLRGNPRTVLGANYAPLRLFRSAPG